MENNTNKRGRDDSDEFEEFGSVEVKRLKDDLLGFLDDSDLSSTAQDLDSFIKTFEDEIKYPSPPPPSLDFNPDSRPELCFLFGASDDELGLPPSTTTDNTASPSVPSELPELGELFGFDDHLPSYYFDPPESSGIEQGPGNGFSDNGEYVALDGLFDYSELRMESAEFSWHPETMPAQ